MPVNAIPTYRRDIDGLRGIAVLLVVAYHAFPMSLSGGFVGVDVFFVVSGYLISTIVFTSLERGGFSFVDFYSRRIRRIFPALILVLLTTYAVGRFLLLASEFRQLGKHVAAGAAFLSNIVLWREAGYFDVAAELKPLLHLWSLGIEEQFYLMWPLILWASWRRKWSFVTVMAISLVASFAMNVVLISSKPVMTFYMPYTRLWELVAGAILARRDVDISRHSPPANAQSVAGLALVGASAVLFSSKTQFPGYWAVLPVLGTCLLIPASQREAWVNRRILSVPGIVWLGLISYPLYLWHWPLLSMARLIASRTPSLQVRTGLVLVAVLLAFLTYTFVERPLKQWGHRALAFTVLPSLLLAVGAAGWGASERNDVPPRIEIARAPAVLQHAAAEVLPADRRPHATPAAETGPNHRRPPKSTDVSLQSGPVERQPRAEVRTAESKPMSIDNAEPPRQPAVVEQPQADVASDDEFREVLFHDIDECRRRYPFAQDSYCGLSSLSMEPTVMVIGDSHSRAYFTALSLYFERRGRAVVWFGIGGCPPFLRVVRPLGDTVIDCNRVTASATDYLSRAPAIDTVILASAFSMYTSGLRENTESSTDGGIELFRRGLNDVVAKVESFGRKVIVLHQVPMLGFDPKLCRSRPLRPATVNPCQERRELSVTKFAEYKAVVSGVLAEHPRAREVDPMDIFCGPTICPAEFGGRVLYFDTNHINVFGSVFFGAAADRRNLFE